MNEKERQILQLIIADPFLTQNELAEKTNLSRSAVAGYIASLIKKGNIIGRAYVVPTKKQVVCIGGSNIDRKIQVFNELEFDTSNPAKTVQSIGGVARNVAENLGRLGVDVALLSIIGNDYDGEWILNETKNFVDLRGMEVVEDGPTGTYTAILNESGEMVVALADMNIYDELDEQFVLKQWGNIVNANYVLVDTNLPSAVLEKLITRCKDEGLPLCVVPVSAPKVKRLPKDLRGVNILITNKDEAESLTNKKIVSETDHIEVATSIINRGVETVIITRGQKGVFYLNKNGESKSLQSFNVDVVDVTGAGDSFVAGVLYGIINDYSINDACKIGMTVSAITLQTNKTVNEQLTETMLHDLLKENKVI